jgi:hypothetical protein
MEPFSRQAARARRKAASFSVRPQSRGKLIGPPIICKGGSAGKPRPLFRIRHGSDDDERHRVEDNAIHLARELRDITVREQ